MILLAIIAILFVAATIVVVYKESKTKKIELDVNFVIGSIDSVCENFKVGSNVNVAGILGTDFLNKYNYVIDFKRNRIWHNLHYISFSEAMELLRIPFIVLWQGGRKYIFIIDTGSTNSHISNEALNTLDFDLDTEKKFTTVGCGGGNSTSGMASAKLYYR